MFESREEAGEKLALKLKSFIKSKDYVVVPLLRGGIVLGKKIADYLHLPMKPLAVKKIRAPFNPELGIGAVTFDKTHYLNEELIGELNISADYQKTMLENRYQEAKLLQKFIEEKTKHISWTGKNAIIVDDGVAVGNTAVCAALFLRQQKAKRIILAVPVMSKDTVKNIKKYFDRVVCLKVVGELTSVGEFYDSFPQVGNEEVKKNLKFEI